MRYVLEREPEPEHLWRDTCVIDTMARRPGQRVVCMATYASATVIAQALNAVHDGSRYSGNDIIQRMDAALLRSSETNGG